MADGDELRQRVSALLRSQPCRRINFSLQGAAVDGPGLAEIATRVNAKVIRVSVDPSLNEPATYYYTFLEMAFRDAEPTAETIIHESVHALLHHRKCTATSDLTHEVAAYLSEVLHIKLSRPDYYKKKLPGILGQTIVPGSSVLIYQECAKLIEKHHLERASVYLRWEDYQGVRNAVKAHPHYAPWPWE